MEGIPLRAARRADIPMLLLLWQQMMKEHAALDERLTPHPRAREHMLGNLQRWLNDADRQIVVAEEGRRLLVGFAAAVISGAPEWKTTARVGEITDCYVVAPRRRLGIGRRLVGRIQDQLLEKGVDRLRLLAAAANPGSQAFWGAIGWTPQEIVLEKPATDVETGD